MVLIPADGCWALDNLVFRRSSQSLPRWSRDLLCYLMGSVYFFGGIAKINPDWLMGYPLELWLQRIPSNSPVYWLSQMPQSAMMLSYGGLFFDLTIPFFLLWRRTRLVAFVCAIIFHVINSHLFTIGIFPWLSLALTTLFFAPDWPRRIFRLKSAELAPASTAKPIIWATGLSVVLLTLLPIRHHFLPSDAGWTRAGHLFSWRMKLHSRKGYILFDLVDESNQTRRILPSEILTQRQVNKMASRPELIRQFAHHIRKVEQQKGKEVKVYAQSFLSWNGRPYQRFIDPHVDLSQEPFSWSGYPWVLPNKMANPESVLNPKFHPSIDLKAISYSHQPTVKKIH